MIVVVEIHVSPHCVHCSTGILESGARAEPHLNELIISRKLESQASC